MVFSSVVFIFRFLPMFLICYFAVPGRMKNVILLLGSLIFYAWGEPVYVLLMLFSTFVHFALGRGIGAKRGRPAGRAYLAISVIINLLLLGFFKYADFLIQCVNMLFKTDIPLPGLGLPLGISFYTFQIMSYTIDVYRGDVRAQSNLLDFAVYVTMFPQLIAGPIVKYRQVEGELHNRTVNVPEISRGAKRFVIGLAKKVLIANNLGVLWEQTASMEYSRMSILTAWIGIIAFALQIYFDFSGYSDMAIGLGYIMGFKFPENFNYPYISASVSEFWRRWHISLGSWFREYVYIPLGGGRKGMGRQLFNIAVVWLLTGIWHGAGINFVIWGLWFALFLILEKLFLEKVLAALPKLAGCVYTWLVVILGWVFFSLDTPGQAVLYIKALFGLNGGDVFDSQALFLLGEYIVILVISALAATPLVKMLENKVKSKGSGYSVAVYRFCEKLFIPFLLIMSIAFIVEASYNPFLYFRF
ncbi:MAG: MBOAT family protein [Lachnospiraceae bacterium]|nr:MBOAT family protein [Lachnospiraceae bacterium]